MMYRYFALLLIAGLCQSMLAQDAKKPAFHGGNPNLILNLQEPGKSTIKKVPAYDYYKFYGNKVAPPPRRSCATVEVEKTRTTNNRVETSEQFEDWMHRKLQVAYSDKRATSRGQEQYSIPTVVHVIYSSPVENISREQVMSQIRILNEDYGRTNPDQANTPREFRSLAVSSGIEFCMATVDPFGNPTDGINRVSMGRGPFTESYINTYIKPQTIWDPERYLNIWVCNIANGILGFAQFPESGNIVGLPGVQGGASTDGVVVNYIAFGDMGTALYPYNRGRTGTHEVGHWLGLRHIWGDGPCGTDDYCNDTPETDRPTYECPPGGINCRGGRAMIQNFMDYTDDACMNLFTNDQRIRMRTVLESSPRRKSLLNSNGCRQGVRPPEPAFLADVQQGCEPLTVQFQDASTFNPATYSWSFPGGRPSASNQANPKITYRTPGFYPVTLTVANAGGSRTITKQDYIEVLANGEILPFTLDFEGEPFLSSNTHLNNPQQDYTWERNLRVSGKGQGKGAMSINNYDNNLRNSSDWFILPTLSLVGEPEPVLSFDLAYAIYNGSYTDTLGVFIATDCETEFRNIYFKGGSSLSTADPISSPFTPDPGDWRTEAIDLSDYVGMSNVQIAFVNFNGHGNDIYLDNIYVGKRRGNLPEPDFRPSRSTICAGQEVSFEDLSDGNPERWVWTFPGGYPASDTTSNPTIKYQNAGKYDVILTVYNDAGQQTVQKKSVISVQGTPEIELKASKTSICLGEEITLTALTDISYRWELGEGITPPASNQITFKPEKDAVYKIETIGSGRCLASSSVAVRVNQAKKLEITPPSVTICQGESVTLKATGAQDYFWTPATGLSKVQQGFVEASPRETTTYTVLGITAEGCEIREKVTVNVQGGPSSFTVEAEGGSKTICAGENITLNAKGAVGYQWSPGEFLNRTDGSKVLAQPASTTTFTVKGLTENNCSVERKITIEVDPGPEVSAYTNLDSVCPGTEIRLNASGASSFEWMGDPSLLETRGAVVYAKPLKAAAFQVVGYSINGCTDTSVLYVGVFENRGIKLTSDRSAVCVGGMVEIEAEGGSSYQWFEDGEPLGYAPNVNQISSRVYQRKNITVVGRDNRGCSFRESLTIAVAEGNADLEANFRADNRFVCAGQEVQFFSESPGASTFVWEFPTGTPSSSSQSNPVIVFEEEGVHDVFLTVQGCNGVQDQEEKIAFISVTEPISVNLNARENETICRGSSFTLVASGGASRYEWSPSIGLDKSTGSRVKASPQKTTTYTVTGSAGGGCKASRQVKIEVIEGSEPVKISTLAPTICKGEEVALSTQGGGEFKWYPQASLDDPYAATVFASPTKTTTYTVERIDPYGCLSRDQVLVNVEPGFNFSVFPGKANICPGGQINLSIQDEGVFHWSPDYGLNTTVGKEVIAFPGETTEYTITGTNDAGCKGETKLEVAVRQASFITVEALDEVLCKGDTTKLVVEGASQVRWSPSRGLESASGTDIKAFPTETTTYTATVGEDVCQAIFEVTIEVVDPQNIEIMPKQPEICKGERLELTASNSFGLKWVEQEGLMSNSGASAIVRPLETTSYIVEGFDINGCNTRGSVTVTVRESDFLSTTASVSSFCDEANGVSLRVEGAQEVRWLPANGMGENTRGVDILVNPDRKTMYKVVGVNEYGCKDTGYVEVDVNIPQAEFTVTETEVDLADGPATIQFFDQTIDAHKWTWDFGDGSSATEQNPVHIYTQPGIYTVILKVSNGVCSAKAMEKIIVRNSSSLFDISEEGNIRVIKSPTKPGLFTLEIESPRDMYLELRLLDAGGATLINGLARVDSGIYRQEIDLTSYDSGIYYIQVLDGADLQTFELRKE